jgi:hypothetical protein
MSVPEQIHDAVPGRVRDPFPHTRCGTPVKLSSGGPQLVMVDVRRERGRGVGRLVTEHNSANGLARAV